MDFSKQIQKADEAVRRRNYDFAVELYRQLLDLDADLGEARAGLRQALKRRHESKRGGRLLRAVGGALPLANAKAMNKLGRHDACAKALEDYLKSNPLDEEANLLLGQSLESAGHFRSARAAYEFVAEIAPRNPEGLKSAGAMSYREGDHAKALEYYERALKADPRDQEAIKARKNLAAEAALTQTGLEQASHGRERMVGGGAQSDGARAQAPREARRPRSEEELRSELERLEGQLADSGPDPALLVEAADVYEKLGDLEAALEFVDRAAQYRKGDFELLVRAGDLQSKVFKRRIAKAGKQGDEARATALEGELIQLEVSDYRRRVEARPADAALRLGLGKRLMRADDLDGALAAFQQCRSDPRVRADAVYHLALCFRRKGVLDLARKELERSLEDLGQGQGSGSANERSKEILYTLGAIAEEEGDREAARSYYIRIYEVDVAYRDVSSKIEAL